MGGSFGTSKSKARNNQNIWDGQQGALQNLYGNAENLFGSQDFGQLQNLADQSQPYMQDIANNALSGYQGMLSGGSIGDTNEIRDRLLSSMGGRSNMGQMYESIVGGSGNTYIDPMVDAMKRSSMENLDRMQANTGLDATAMGQSGSSRHAMQNAMQARNINSDMLDREMTMRGGAYDTDLNMKMDIARMADSNRQAEQDRLAGMLGASDRNVQSGLGFGQAMQNLGMGTLAPQLQAYQAPWQAMGSYANTIGAPTVLGSGSQRGKGVGSSASLKG